MKELIDAGAKFVIAGTVIIGCLIVIGLNPADENTQPWAIITLIVGWLIGDNSNSSATNSVLRVQAAGPTVTATSGPPASVTSTPGGTT